MEQFEERFHRAKQVMEILASDFDLFGRMNSERWMRGEKHLLKMAHLVREENNNETAKLLKLLRRSLTAINEFMNANDFLDFSFLEEVEKLQGEIDLSLHSWLLRERLLNQNSSNNTETAKEGNP